MSDQKHSKYAQFTGDDRIVHATVPSSVIAAVPSAKTLAEKYGHGLRFDFLDDTAVHRMLFHRWEDNRKAGAVGCPGSVPLTVFGFGAWPFWDFVASQRPGSFQIAFIGVDALIVVGLLVGMYLWRRASLLDPSMRNVRIRARRYREIAGAARRGGADIPARYPYYGMHASSRKFFPDAPELPMSGAEQRG
ncbi:hypothetical protein AB0D33_33445 [Streptomyces sp. NPDC048404]|uniref:hypothetical protein n=1 Tax=unclassified Streptomyces TaxID=2593676 RepID=UPI00341CE27F